MRSVRAAPRPPAQHHADARVTRDRDAPRPRLSSQGAWLMQEEPLWLSGPRPAFPDTGESSLRVNSAKRYVPMFLEVSRDKVVLSSPKQRRRDSRNVG